MFSLLFKYPLQSYRDGEFVFLSNLPGEARLVLFVAAVALLWWMYRRARDRVNRRRYRWLLGLRLALFTLLLIMLSMPALRTADPSDTAVFTAVLVDSSRSMSIDDAAGVNEGLTRMAAAQQLLGENGGVLEALNDAGTPIVYAFDQTLRRTTPDAIKAEGRYTNLFRSVRDMEAELRALPLSSVVLITDGARNKGGDPLDAARLLANRGVPLHIIGIGSDPPPRDYEVVRVVAPQTVRRNTEVELFITVRHTDLHEPFDVLVKRDEGVLLTHPVQPDARTDLTRLRIVFTPDHDGTATYTVEIPQTEGESITQNNRRDFRITIEDDRLPVLYIEGSPRMEYRFIRRAMMRDPRFRVVGMLRLASDQFYIQGATPDDPPLINGFPTTLADLGKFQAIVLGDVEASYFSADQLELIERFVRERGGGLAMLGGVNSFGLGGYANTPVGKTLPVNITPHDGQYTDSQYTAVLNPDGMTHPVMRLEQDPQINERLWNTMPPLIGMTPVAGVKRGASLLVEQEGTGQPVVAVQNYGAGRVAAFTSGGSWYWQVSMPAVNEFHERFWKQLVRWLVMGAKDHLTARTDAQTYARGDAVLVLATVLGEDLRPVNDAQLTCTIADPLGNEHELAMSWILSEEGVYQCRYVPEDEGAYTATVNVSDMDVNPAVTHFVVSEPTVEFADAGLKGSLLTEMASMTGGVYATYANAQPVIDRAAADARAARYAGAEVDLASLWDVPALYVTLLGLMIAEWLLRRRSGLA